MSDMYHGRGDLQAWEVLAPHVLLKVLLIVFLLAAKTRQGDRQSSGDHMQSCAGSQCRLDIFVYTTPHIMTQMFECVSCSSLCERATLLAGFWSLMLELWKSDQMYNVIIIKHFTHLKSRLLRKSWRCCVKHVLYFSHSFTWQRDGTVRTNNIHSIGEKGIG